MTHDTLQNDPVRPPLAARPIGWVALGAVMALTTSWAWQAGLARGALAAAPGGASARAVHAFPMPLDRDRTGIVMVDSDTSTLWVYELMPQQRDAIGAPVDGQPVMKLLAARSFAYDRYLHDFNQIEPTRPEQIRELVGDRATAAAPPGQPAGRPLGQADMPNAGVELHPVQLARDRYGLAMFDRAEGTVWMYELLTGGGGTMPNSMRLIAARRWLYDRWLDDYRQAAPGPAAVLDLVNRQHGAPPTPPSPATPAQ